LEAVDDELDDEEKNDDEDEFESELVPGVNSSNSSLATADEDVSRGGVLGDRFDDDAVAECTK
jgi:hypothetical protein